MSDGYPRGWHKHKCNECGVSVEHITDKDCRTPLNKCTKSCIYKEVLHPWLNDLTAYAKMLESNELPHMLEFDGKFRLSCAVCEQARQAQLNYLFEKVKIKEQQHL